MTERQLKTNYFINSHLLHLIFQAPGARPALPVDSLVAILDEMGMCKRVHDEGILKHTLS